ncbi:cutinase family protein [Nocardia sp. CA-135953]|uniref:cutinase family protein n=1 Tax=Nocardia sp. CA-135953 TaxID=3239978 RepID=UPI003D996A2A
MRRFQRARVRCVQRGAHRAPVRVLAASATAIAALIAMTGVAWSQPTSELPAGTECPALYVLGIQPAEETSPDAASTTDTGMLGTMFRPLLAETGTKVQRAYVALDATAATGSLSAAGDGYTRAISAAADRLVESATRVLQKCPDTLLGGAGYAQGAHALSEFSRRVGTGATAIPADHIAGIALIANPARQRDSEVLPGRPGQTTPTAPPSLPDSAVSAITLPNTRLAGGGIAAALGSHAIGSASYGTLTGRVADLCAPGDLACNTPDHAALLQVVSNVAARADLHDPIAAISTIATAMAQTIYTTAINVVTDDVQGTSLDQISYAPEKSISQRLAEASDPRTQIPGPNDAIQALMKLGTIAFNSAVTIAEKVITPATVAELIGIGLVDPVGALATLGTKLAAAAVELIPPATGTRLVQQAFDAVRDNITDNADLVDIGLLTQAADVIGRRADYGASSNGQQSLMTVAAHWFAALADSRDQHPPDSSVTPSPAGVTTPASVPSGEPHTPSTHRVAPPEELPAN